MTRQQKLDRRRMTPKEKFVQRWKSRQKISVFPHGYLTTAYWAHEAINIRAGMDDQMREIIFRSSMSSDREFIFKAPVIAIYYRYLNFRKP